MSTQVLVPEGGDTGVVPLRRAAARAHATGGSRVLVRYVVGPLVTVLVASFVIYFGLSLAPGDPVAQILGARASDADRAALRLELGLDQPIVVQYGNWLMSVLQGDFGISYVSRQPVSTLVGPRIPTTLLLIAMAAVLILLVGVGLGILGGTKRRWRSPVNVLSSLGVAVPGFVAASALISIFAVQLRWFPTYGAGRGLWDNVYHLVLPAIALALAYSAYVTQLSAAAIEEDSEKEHVATARGRGLPRGQIVRRHILRNAAMPILTASGLTVAGLFAGAVIVEEAFSIDGLGSLLIDGVFGKDYAVVATVSLFIIAAFVVVTTLLDALYGVLDPRMRGQS